MSRHYESDENLSTGNEYDDAILMIQPDETSGQKALRRLVDKIFIGRDPFLISSAAYEDMQANEDGVSNQLRSMLFPPSKQVKRRGKRKDHSNDPESAVVPNAANRQVQRQSKQKERCENKFMSLLFATVYDHATKRCRLVREVPPLKLIKTDKKGKYRNVSNYTEVRAYLRNKMSVILAAHVSAVKVLLQMIQSVFHSIPFMFMLLARTFLVMYTLEHRRNEQEGNESESSSIDDHCRQVASDTLYICISFIQEYLDEWGRRSYTKDNPLKHFRTAGVKDDCYKAVFKLLRTMISIHPPSPSFPYIRRAREACLYNLSLPIEGRCIAAPGVCSLQSLCPANAALKQVSKQPSASSLSGLEACREFVHDLCVCASTGTHLDFSLIDAELRDPEFPAAIWRTCISNIDLHRLKDLSSRLDSSSVMEKGSISRSGLDFIARVRYDVGLFWAALFRSNAKHIAIVESLELQDEQVIRGTVVELLFGGGIPATAVFEREDEIRPITDKLRGRKSKSFLSRERATRTAHDPQDAQLEDADNTKHANRIQTHDMQRQQSVHEEPDRHEGPLITLVIPGDHESDKVSSEGEVPENREGSLGNATENAIERTDRDKIPDNHECDEAASRDEEVDFDVGTASISRRKGRQSKRKLPPSSRSGDGNAKRRKRRGTITQTIQEANIYPTTGPRLRKRSSRNYSYLQLRNKQLATGHLAN